MEELRFSVGTVEWSVKLVDDIPPIAGSFMWGCCVFPTHTIMVSSKSSSKMRLLVLLHELYHAWRGGWGPKEPGEEGEAEWFGMVTSQIILQALDQLPAMERFLGCPVTQIKRPVASCQS